MKQKVYIFLYTLDSEQVNFIETTLLDVSEVVSSHAGLFAITTPPSMKYLIGNDITTFSKGQLDKPIINNDKLPYILIFSFDKANLKEVVTKLLINVQDELKRLTFRANNFIEFMDSLGEK